MRRPRTGGSSTRACAAHSTLSSPANYCQARRQRDAAAALGGVFLAAAPHRRHLGRRTNEALAGAHTGGPLSVPQQSGTEMSTRSSCLRAYSRVWPARSRRRKGREPGGMVPHIGIANCKWQHFRERRIQCTGKSVTGSGAVAAALPPLLYMRSSCVSSGSRTAQGGCRRGAAPSPAIGTSYSRARKGGFGGLRRQLHAPLSSA